MSESFVPLIARRLAGALLAILFVFGAAVVLTRIALERIADAEDDVVAYERRKHASQALASELREQALHQAHVLFGVEPAAGKNDEIAATHVQAAARELVAAASGADAELVARIVAYAAKIEHVFRNGAADRARDDVARDIAALVDDVVVLTDELDRSFSARGQQAVARAAEVRAQASTIMVLCFSIAFALAVVVGTLLARSIIRPVAALWAGARRVGSGDLSTRVRVEGKDELAKLAASFNQMTSDLEVKQAALVRTQKLAAIGQLAAGVAHEINNPLSVILGYAKLMRRAPELASRDELVAIEDEARQCQRIVQELLDLARPNQLELAACDLGELVRTEVARLEETGVLAGRHVTSPSHTVSVNADEDKLRQVVANLVLNAAQATPEGGSIIIELSSGAEHVAIDICDTGAGMSPDVLARVFEPFFTTKRRGTGLGLAIAQAIADAHGGRIEIESDVDRGTRARVILPLRYPERHS